MRSRFAVALWLALATAIACGSEAALRQGDEYTPDGTLPLGTPTDRADAGTCEDSGCDAGADAAPLALPDGSTEPINTCETARAIGTLAGDLGFKSVTAKGECSEWLSFRATEDDSSALGAPMKVKLTLTMVGGDFELYAFLDKDRDRVSCGAPIAQSFKAGTLAEEIALTWGEGAVANGSDDSRTVGVAVIRASGPCGAGSGTWTLTAEGNE